MITYKVTNELTAFNRDTKKERVFAVNETVKGTPITEPDGTVSTVNVDGYILPVESLKQIAPYTVWLLAGVGVAFVIIAIVLIIKYKK